jgi:acetolactate synthase-1/3 small subunit
VLKVLDYSGRDIVQRDLALVKLSAPPAKRPEIVSLIEIFRGNVVDISLTDMVVELSGPEAKVDAFVEMVRPYGIRELVRTGLVALARGEQK